MIVWRGCGILVIVSAVACLVAAMAGAKHIWGDPLPIELRKWTELAAMWAAAALVQGMQVLLSKQTARTVIDKETGKEFVLAAAPHDLFFVPVKYWPWLLTGLGVLFFYQ